jgi:hypothetical protein
LNDTPFVPSAVNALLITGAGGFTVSDKVAFPVPPALVAVSFTENGPATVGAPEIKPVDGSTASPAGSPVAP